MDESRAGEEIGQYRLLRKLGEGGMGEVFLGEHRFTGRRAALKMISGRGGGDKAVARLMDEARALGSLRHPGIVDVLDFFEDRGRHYLVMEFIDGEPLDRLLREGGIPVARGLEIALQAGAALAAAHAKGILHRDIKPQNVMIGRDGAVKLMDFGLAKFAEAGTITSANVVMGTPRYMSPEQCRGRPLDPRSDQYAFGVLLYRLAAGREPFTEGDSIALAMQHIHDRPEPPERLNPAIPPALSRVILRALAKAPEDRYPDLEALLRELAAARAEIGAQGESTQPLAQTIKLEPAAPAAPAAATPDGMRLTGVRAVKTPGAGGSPAAARRGPRAAAIGAGAVLLGAAVALGIFAARRGTPPSGAPASPAAGSPAPVPPAVEPNPWVTVPAPTPEQTYRLGVPDSAPAAQPGLRSARAIRVPDAAYRLQRREVTWGEIAPWLAAHPEFAFPPPAGVPADAAGRAKRPVTGIPWTAADAYCRSLGGALPTEEQWEGAILRLTQGAVRLPFASFDTRINAFRGADGAPAAVGGESYPIAPGAPETDRFEDLYGNAQEWTASPWREDRPGRDESWVNEAGVRYVAVRGLPVDRAPPAGDFYPTAWREPLCAEGPCVEKFPEARRLVGFRCAAPAP